MPYRPAPRMEALPELYDVVAPARFPRLVLRWRNQRWAERIGLGALTAEAWQAHFGRFEPLPDNLPRPLALRYHGHQFRTYNPGLGDGRGFLFAQVLDDDGRLLDLATKGSGQTPWSRGGDGRLTLKGGVREVLATELLEALGVPTSKSFSLFETGEALHRHDEPSPTRASVLVRLGHSHVRFGSFQRLHYLGDRTTLRALLAYAIEHYAPELCHLAPEAAAPAFLRLVVERSANLAAWWMAAGFVHGVLNTDNLNITGESFDYGPYRFLPVLDPAFTAAYFDHSGLYAYGQQPISVHWALDQLAQALALLAPDRELAGIVRAFPAACEAALDRAFLARLGVTARGAPHDRLLRGAVMRYLEATRMPFERFFFDAYGGAAAQARLARSPFAAEYRTLAAAELMTDLARYAPRPTARLDHPYFADAAPCTLLIEELEDLWAPIAVRDDWAPLEAKLAAIRRMGEALAG